MVAQLINLECMSLKTALQIFQEGGDEQADIPRIVRLLENSASPIALPGKIDLFNHDCLHILFERGISSCDEAFILGVTFGSHPGFNYFHQAIFDYFSRFLYPHPYRFTLEHLKMLKLAFSYARKRKFPNFSQIDFRAIDFQESTIANLRIGLGIQQNDLTYLNFSD
jgi:hypothetical protein